MEENLRKKWERERQINDFEKRLTRLEDLIIKDRRYEIMEEAVKEIINAQDKRKDAFYKIMVGVGISVGGVVALWALNTLISAI